MLVLPLLVGLANAAEPVDLAREALAAGDCDAVERQARKAKEPAVAARIQGDAHRCRGEVPQALWSYRQALAVEPDPSLERLVDNLSSQVATAQVRLVGLSEGAPLPEVLLRWQDHELAPAGQAPPVFTFQDVPVQGEVLLVVRFQGQDPVQEALKARRAGSRLDLSFDVADLAPPAPATGGMVSVLDAPDDTSLLIPGASTQAIEVQAPPKAHPDPAWGVPLAEPAQLADLPGGTWKLQATHPVLGTTSTEILVVEGEVTPVRLDLASFPRADELRIAWEAWQLADAQRKGGPSGRTWAGVGAGVLGLGAIGGGIALARSTQSQLDLARAEYQSLAASQEIDEARARYEEIGRIKRSFSVPVVTIGVGAVGVGLGTWLGLDGARQARSVEGVVAPWDPETALGGE